MDLDVHIQIISKSVLSYFKQIAFQRVVTDFISEK